MVFLVCCCLSKPERKESLKTLWRGCFQWLYQHCKEMCFETGCRHELSMWWSDWQLFPLPSHSFLWNFLLHISVQVLELWKFSCKFSKNSLFQWLICSLFPEKNLQCILAAKQALREWSSLSTSIIKAACLSCSPVKVQPSLSDAYATKEYNLHILRFTQQLLL